MNLDIGTIVDFHGIIGGPVSKYGCIVKSEPWQLGSGEWVIQISGVSGGVSLDALSLPEKPPNCTTCKYVRTIPGDVHKSCTNHNANVTCAELGIRKGYFLWPWNFDPRWLKACNGYEKREETKS